MFQAPDADICDYLQDNIFHVHGTLAPYCRFDSKSGRRYISKCDLPTIKRAMHAIRVVHEVGKIPEKQRINTRIESADRLVFLGFGYAPDNIAKLFYGIQSPPKRIMGSSFGLSSAEVKTARQRIAAALRISESTISIDNKSDLGCHDWLREYFEFA